MVNWEEGEKAFMGAEGRIYAQFAFDENLSGRLMTRCVCE